MTPEGIAEDAHDISIALDLICEEEHAVHEFWQLRPELPHWIKVECGYKDQGAVAYFLSTRCSEELKWLIIAGSLK